MDEHVNEFFSEKTEEIPHGNYHKAIALHDNPDISWKSVNARIPSLCKGWFELARLPSSDRIEFLKDFWLSTLPYKPKNHQSLLDFFKRLDDIGVYIIQQKFADPFECKLVYSLRNNQGFYHGGVGATEEEIGLLQRLFPDHIIPEDYLSFIKIHNGFCKATDTGVLRIDDIKENYEAFQALLETGDPISLDEAKFIEPKTLIPFYKSFGMPVFQCFWSEWYPEQEMGNVYYSNFSRTISESKQEKEVSENLSFPTFVDWLCFYLEKVS